MYRLVLVPAANLTYGAVVTGCLVLHAETDGYAVQLSGFPWEAAA